MEHRNESKELKRVDNERNSVVGSCLYCSVEISYTVGKDVMTGSHK